MSLEVGKEDLFREFLTELQALDDFRNEYASRYDFEGLGRDDQDVRRLMEAMAFYAARTRAGVERAMHRYKLQALEQLFPHLLSPMPAMALLYPVLTSNVTETRRLSRSAEVQVASGPPASPASARAALAVAAPAADAPPARRFRVLTDIDVFPLHLVERSVRLVKAPNAPSVLSLMLAASPHASESKRYYADLELPLRELSLYINPQGDPLLALRVFDALEQALYRVTARFFSEGVQRHEIITRRVRFGLRESEGSGWENPIEVARRSIHYPLCELCLGIPLDGAPAEWTWMTLELELDERWPQNLAVSDQSFLLNAGPIENVVRRTAEPIDADGTRSRHRLQHQEPKTGLKVREVLGVYRGDPTTPGARTTLLPSALAGEGYTLEVEGRGPGRDTWLETDSVLGSLDAPERLYVDADWYVPDPRLPNGREAHVSIEDHDLGAMLWRVADPLRAPHESAFLGDARALERLLELHGRRLRSVADLDLLLQVLGVPESEVLARVPRYIASLASSLVPDARAASGGVRAYDLTLSELPPVLAPAARLLFRLLPGVLGIWSGDMEVQVRVTSEALGADPAVFEWRAKDDG